MPGQLGSNTVELGPMWLPMLLPWFSHHQVRGAHLPFLVSRRHVVVISIRRPRETGPTQQVHAHNSAVVLRRFDLRSRHEDPACSAQLDPMARCLVRDVCVEIHNDAVSIVADVTNGRQRFGDVARYPKCGGATTSAFPELTMMSNGVASRPLASLLHNNIVDCAKITHSWRQAWFGNMKVPGGMRHAPTRLRRNRHVSRGKSIGCHPPQAHRECQHASLAIGSTYKSRSDSSSTF